MARYKVVYGHYGHRIADALERIATVLETTIDAKKRTLRMVDLERGKVYKTHLGKSLRK
jgi:chemotaxis regulatin CheY-phosphate phosphatase CheZ